MEPSASSAAILPSMLAPCAISLARASSASRISGSIDSTKVEFVM
jgi:hypothetical protein